jgi:hypothetical protein
MTGRLMNYDNEKDLKLLVDDSVEFIMSETKRIVEQYYDKDDGNAYILVAQNLTLSFVLNVMNVLRLKEEAFMRAFEIKDKTGDNHLPVNRKDFFKGMIP